MEVARPHYAEKLKAEWELPDEPPPPRKRRAAAVLEEPEEEATEPSNTIQLLLPTSTRKRVRRGSGNA